MAQAEFTLQERDRKRFITDRLFRFAVSCGGVGVLAALVLIFIYLAMIILPLFSDASIKTSVKTLPLELNSPVAVSIDDYAQRAYTIERDGVVAFWDLDQQQNILTQQLPIVPTGYAKTVSAQGWHGFVDLRGQVVLFKPEYRSLLSKTKQSPEIQYLPHGIELPESGVDNPVLNFTFSVDEQRRATVAWYDTQNQVRILWQNHQGSYQYVTLKQPLAQLDQMLLSPDGNLLYLRTGSELVVVSKQKQEFVVREVLDLTQGDTKHSVRTIDMLSGAYSLMVTHNDGKVSQWFDVWQGEERTLAHIRDFKLASEVQFLLPDSYRKGFYSFYTNGTLQSHYTTSEKLALFNRAYDKAPLLAAMSRNEQYLVTYDTQGLSVAHVDNPYPEVSLSSLWQQVWYEGYPEPDFVWQSTSASDDFEAKFSMVPIAFGTIKAAMFAMLFSVPLAVCGAIYTAYFMSPRMRRIVKPSIELMEALPTVIIGFLAGLWFAPIIENHLITVLVAVVVLPCSTILIGGLWSCIPMAFRHRLPNGLHALILMPALVAMLALIIVTAPHIEQWAFDGDIRLYLTEQGIGFDQRNALVVGLAMGFAVIPTIFTIAEDAIFSVPKHLSDGSLALGATQWQTLVYVVLLTASPGIFSAIMMGLGRAVGETMIVLMATGNTPLLDWNILEGMRTLSATIAVELPESEVGSSHYRLLFLAALILFIFTFAVNSLAELVRQRLRDKYRAL